MTLYVNAPEAPRALTALDEVLVKLAGDPRMYTALISEVLGLLGLNFGVQEFDLTGIGPYTLGHNFNGGLKLLFADGMLQRPGDLTLASGSDQVTVTSGIGSGYTRIIVVYTY